MAENSWFYDAGAGSNVTEDRWRQAARFWVTGGDGVLLGELLNLEAFGDSTGLQVKVRTGRAWVRGAAYENDAQLTKAIASNPSGSTRIDRVVLRNDFAANATTVVVITGTPGAGAPALGQVASPTTVFDVPLAQVSVASGAATIAAGNVTDERPFVGPLTPTLRVPSTVVRDALLTAPVAGMTVERGGRLERYTGSAWVPLTALTSAGRMGFTASRGSESLATGATWSAITWDVINDDNDNWIAEPSSTATVPTGLDGVYLIEMYALGLSNNLAASLTCRITAGGITVRGPGVVGNTGPSNEPTGASGIFRLAAGNTIQGHAFHTFGSTQAVGFRLNVWRLSA